MYIPDFETQYTSLLSRLATLEPLEKCQSIRDWVAMNVPATFTPKAYFDDDVFIHKMPILDILATLYQERKGLMCGGASLIMARICRENNIYAINGNFGFEFKKLTHMACLVKPYADKELWYVMDPYWGTELITTGGEILDYNQAVTLFNLSHYNEFSLRVFKGTKPLAEIDTATNERTISAKQDWKWQDPKWVSYFDTLLKTKNLAVTYFFPFGAYHYKPR